jgi:hypothetical protein
VNEADLSNPDARGAGEGRQWRALHHSRRHLAGVLEKFSAESVDRLAQASAGHPAGRLVLAAGPASVVRRRLAGRLGRPDFAGQASVHSSGRSVRKRTVRPLEAGAWPSSVAVSA